MPAQEPPAPPKFYFYRYSMFQGVALHPSVFCDGMEVTAGEHTCYMGGKKSGAVVDAEAGKSYYFRVSVQPGVLKGFFRLDLVMPEQGRFDVQGLKPSK